MQITSNHSKWRLEKKNWNEKIWQVWIMSIYQGRYRQPFLHFYLGLQRQWPVSTPGYKASTKIEILVKIVTAVDGCFTILTKSSILDAGIDSNTSLTSWSRQIRHKPNQQGLAWNNYSYWNFDFFNSFAL